MENYGKSAHCIYDIKYHLVWITKYCSPVITGQIALRTRELVRMICQGNEVENLASHVGSGHIHLFVSVLPHLSVSKLVPMYKRKYVKETRYLWDRGEEHYVYTNFSQAFIHPRFDDANRRDSHFVMVSIAD